MRTIGLALLSLALLACSVALLVRNPWSVDLSLLDECLESGAFATGHVVAGETHADHPGLVAPHGRGINSRHLLISGPDGEYAIETDSIRWSGAVRQEGEAVGARKGDVVQVCARQAQPAVLLFPEVHVGLRDDFEQRVRGIHAALWRMTIAAWTVIVTLGAAALVFGWFDTVGARRGWHEHAQALVTVPVRVEAALGLATTGLVGTTPAAILWTFGGDGAAVPAFLWMAFVGLLMAYFVYRRHRFDGDSDLASDELLPFPILRVLKLESPFFDRRQHDVGPRAIHTWAMPVGSASRVRACAVYYCRLESPVISDVGLYPHDSPLGRDPCEGAGAWFPLAYSPLAETHVVRAHNTELRLPSSIVGFCQLYPYTIEILPDRVLMIGTEAAVSDQGLKAFEGLVRLLDRPAPPT